MALNSLDQIIELAQKREIRRIVIAAAEDEPVLKAVKAASDLNIVKPVLVGHKQKILEISEKIEFDINELSVINEADPSAAVSKAVEVIKTGKAEILMKGLVSTAPLLRAVLKKDNGLKKSKLLSHLAVFQTGYYPKLLGVTDAAMNIAPELKEKVSIIENAIEVFHALGIEKPGIAALAPLETVNDKIQSTVDAALLAKMSDREQIKKCKIDCPFALDNAVSPQASVYKKILSLPISCISRL